MSDLQSEAMLADLRKLLAELQVTIIEQKKQIEDLRYELYLVNSDRDKEHDC
jgi:hypothetical protein